MIDQMCKSGLIVLLAGVTTTALPATASDCQYGSLNRSISVRYEVPGQSVPCQVLYEKHDEGVESTPWSAENESGYCEAKAAELHQTLIDLGWACTEAPHNDANNGNPAPA